MLPLYILSLRSSLDILHSIPSSFRRKEITKAPSVSRHINTCSPGHPFIWPGHNAWLSKRANKRAKHKPLQRQRHTSHEDTLGRYVWGWPALKDAKIIQGFLCKAPLSLWLPWQGDSMLCQLSQEAKNNTFCNLWYHCLPASDSMGDRC